MAACSIASSFARLSPNHLRMRAPDFAMNAPTPARIPSPRRVQRDRWTLEHPRSTSNPQRSLNSHQQLGSHSNRYRHAPSVHRAAKRVVFNGTFPIDEPMSSRFDDQYAQDGSDSDYDEDFYREDDGEEYPDYDEHLPDEYHAVGSLDHHLEDGIVGTRSTCSTRDQIREEFETSAHKFDQLCAQRRRDV